MAGIRLDDYYLHFTILVIVLVVLSSLVEVLLHFISNKVKQMKYRHMADIVNCVYRELMVLGIIGAILFVVNEIKPLQFAIGNEGEEDSDIVVDFVHFMLFMIGLLYITLIGAALLFVVHWSYRTWGSQEDVYSGNLATEGETVFLHWYEPIIKFSEYKKIKTKYYYELRQQFITYNQLSDEFDFARYLRKCMRNKIVEMLHIDKYMWAFMLVVVLFNALRVATSGKISEGGSISVGATLGWALLFVYVAVFLYCAHVFMKIIYMQGNEMMDIKTLFLFNRPELILRVIQITTFLQSFYFSLFILAFAPDIVEDIPAGASWLVFIISVLPPIISVAVLMPQIFPIYVLTCSIHNLTNKEAIEATYKEIIKCNRHSVVGFSYAEEYTNERQWRGSMRVSSTFSPSLSPSSLANDSSYCPPSSFSSSSSSSSFAPPLPFKPLNLRSPPLKTRFSDEDEVMYISFCDE